MNPKSGVVSDWPWNKCIFNKQKKKKQATTKSNRLGCRNSFIREDPAGIELRLIYLKSSDRTVEKKKGRKSEKYGEQTFCPLTLKTQRECARNDLFVNEYSFHIYNRFTREIDLEFSNQEFYEIFVFFLRSYTWQQKPQAIIHDRIESKLRTFFVFTFLL